MFLTYHRNVNVRNFASLIVLLVSPHCFCQNVSYRQDPVIVQKREAKEQLYADLYSHKALLFQLSPTMDGVLNVLFCIQLYFIKELAVSKQSMSSVIFYSVQWTDPVLAWDKELYANISEVTIPTHRIWRPGFLIPDTVGNDHKMLLAEPERVSVTSDGTVHMVYADMITTACNFDVTLYPMDVQSCSIVITFQNTDIAYNTEAELIHLNDSLSDDNLKKGEWTVFKREVNMMISPEYKCPYLVFRVHMQRTRMWYLLCMVLPVFLTSFLTVLAFQIPPSSGERMSFLVSIFVSTSLYMNFISSDMPRNFTSVPRISCFLAFVITQGAVAMVISVIVMKMFEEEQRELARKQIEESDATTKPNTIDKYYNGGGLDAWDSNQAKNSQIDNSGFHNVPSDNPDHVSKLQLFHKLAMFKNIASWIANGKKTTERRSRQIDRFCFYLFSATTVFFYTFIIALA